MSNNPLIVGITGGIGSGKTTICKIFEVLGAKTYYADDRAKYLMENDNDLKEKISALFGKLAYKDGKLDRKHVAGQAFYDNSLLEKLNALVHPAVGKDVTTWVKNQQDSPLLLKEAALLFETGSYKSLDKNILVVAPEEMRLQRVLARDTHRSENDVRAIMQKQLSDQEKKKMADFLILNDGKMSVIKQVMEIYNQLVVT